MKASPLYCLVLVLGLAWSVSTPAQAAPRAQATPALFTARISFQPDGSATPAGYLADTGAAYGARGNGYTYGWSANNRANTRARNALADQRYDTLAHMQNNGSFAWQIAVPPGRYTVRIVAGDASFINSFYQITAEGTAVINAAPTAAMRWLEGQQVIAVSDGKLTLRNGAKAVNNKINFIEISQHWQARINFQPAGAALPKDYLADTGAAYGARSTGYTYGWDADISAATRDRNATSDQRYDTLIHTQLNGAHSWSLALPNGGYDLRIVAGDPAFFNSVYALDANGSAALRATPNSGARWADTTIGIAISDGRLALTNGAGAINNKLSFIEIIAQSAPAATPPIFIDDFERPNGPDLGSNWVQFGWQIRGGAAYNYERGFASLRSAQAFAAASYTLETRAIGFGSLQGPSPADSTDLIFGAPDAESANYYRVIYFPSAAGFDHLALQRVSTEPSGEITTTTLDHADIVLPTDRFLQWKVVRDGPSGLIQVFIDMGAGFYQPIPLLQASDSSYATLGHFGWVLESQSVGDFYVDWFKVRS